MPAEGLRMTANVNSLFDAAPRRDGAAEALAAAARERILILDGAMGTQIQGLGFDENHFRGERFAGCDCHLQGNNDLLTLTQPRRSRPSISPMRWPAPTSSRPTPSPRPRIAQADYGMQEAVYELNRDGARLARRAALKAERRGRQARASSPARSARPTAPPRSRPTSTIPASARSPSTICATAYAEQIARPDRRRRRPHPDRDDLRHAERQGGDLRLRGGLRRARPCACR